jgi:hypothetical protein
VERAEPVPCFVLAVARRIFMTDRDAGEGHTASRRSIESIFEDETVSSQDITLRLHSDIVLEKSPCWCIMSCIYLALVST